MDMSMFIDGSHEVAPVATPAATRPLSTAGSGFSFVLLKALFMSLPVLDCALLAYARCWGSMGTMDSTGVVHRIALSETFNFEVVFIHNSTICALALLGHLWITVSEVATCRSLDLDFRVHGQTLAERAKEAKNDLRGLSCHEKAHCVLLALNALFGAWILQIFRGLQITGDVIRLTLVGCFIVGVPASYGILVWVVASSRHKVIENQRHRLREFANTAVRWSLLVLTLQVTYCAKFMGDVLWRYHTTLKIFNRCHPPTARPDPNTTKAVPAVTYVRDCDIATFRPPIIPTAHDSDAYFPFITVDSKYGLTPPEWRMETNSWSRKHIDLDLSTGPNAGDALLCQAWSTSVPIYLSFTATLYLMARGQGILPAPAKLLDQLGSNHTIVIVLWIVASTMALYVNVLGSTRTIYPNGCGHVGWFLAVMFLAFGGIIFVLWYWDSLFTAVLQGINKGILGDDGKACDSKRMIFGSMRFGASDLDPSQHEVVPMAERLQTELRKRSIELKIINLTSGDDIDEEVFNGIEQCDTFLVFGSLQYGEKTDNQACTYFEYKHAFARQKRILPLRMIPWDTDFAHVQARQIFGANTLVLEWQVGEQIPQNLVKDIEKALELDRFLPEAL